MKAIVHIGTEKTGTTSIQKFLYQNRKKLKKAGFHFIQSAGKTNNRAIPAYCVNDDRLDDFFRINRLNTPEEKETFRRQFLKDFSKEIQSLPRSIHTVIISSEHFHSRIRTKEDMDNVHKFLSNYFDGFRILCYLRDQVSTCTSYYSTAVKSGNTSSFNEFLQRCNPSSYYFNYQQVLANWERCFGLEALEVSLFSREHFLNGDLLEDFAAKIEPKLIGTLNTNIQIENESLTPAGQSLARAVNIAFPVRSARPELGAIRDKCKVFINDRFKGAGRQPSVASQREIFSAFAEVNEALRESFFPHMDALFKPPVEAEAPATIIGDDFVEGLTTVLNLVKTAGKGVIEPDEYAHVYRSIVTSVADITFVDGEVAKEGREAIVSAEELRLLRYVAYKIDDKDLESAKKLLELVQEIDPELAGVAQKLEDYARRVEQPMPYLYIIKYSADFTTLEDKSMQKFTDKFAVWLDSFMDYILGSTINALANTLVVTSSEMIEAPKRNESSGFTVVRIDSAERAHDIARRCPHVEFGGTVEVSEMLQLSPEG